MNQLIASGHREGETPVPLPEGSSKGLCPYDARLQGLAVTPKAWGSIFPIPHLGTG